MKNYDIDTKRFILENAPNLELVNYKIEYGRIHSECYDVHNCFFSKTQREN